MGRGWLPILFYYSLPGGDSSYLFHETHASLIDNTYLDDRFSGMIHLLLCQATCCIWIVSEVGTNQSHTYLIFAHFIFWCRGNSIIFVCVFKYAHKHTLADWVTNFPTLAIPSFWGNIQLQPKKYTRQQQQNTLVDDISCPSLPLSRWVVSGSVLMMIMTVWGVSWGVKMGRRKRDRL